MQEPTWRTWTKTAVITFVLSLGIGALLGDGFGWREWWRQLQYAIAFATVAWLFALTRWHRANSRM